jgi:hypothetical protein
MVDGVPKVVERFLSEGSYTVTIGEDTFDQILKVLREIPFPELPPMHPVQALEWVSGEKKSHTADLIIEVLSDHVMFKDHYVPRFPYGKEIIRRVDILQSVFSMPQARGHGAEEVDVRERSIRFDY